MGELTPLDEKLGEVLGLAQAAQKCELGHWEIVRTMGKATGEDEVVRLAGRSRSSAGTSTVCGRAAFELAEDEARGS